jgi:hypothetical protein
MSENKPEEEKLAWIEKELYNIVQFIQKVILTLFDTIFRPWKILYELKKTTGQGKELMTKYTYSPFFFIFLILLSLSYQKTYEFLSYNDISISPAQIIRLSNDYIKGVSLIDSLVLCLPVIGFDFLLIFFIYFLYKRPSLLSNVGYVYLNAAFYFIGASLLIFSLTHLYFYSNEENQKYLDKLNWRVFGIYIFWLLIGLIISHSNFYVENELLSRIKQKFLYYYEKEITQRKLKTNSPDLSFFLKLGLYFLTIFRLIEIVFKKQIVNPMYKKRVIGLFFTLALLILVMSTINTKIWKYFLANNDLIQYHPELYITNKKMDEHISMSISKKQGQVFLKVELLLLNNDPNTLSLPINSTLCIIGSQLKNTEHDDVAIKDSLWMELSDTNITKPIEISGNSSASLSFSTHIDSTQYNSFLSTKNKVFLNQRKGIVRVLVRYLPKSEIAKKYAQPMHLSFNTSN